MSITAIVKLTVGILLLLSGGLLLVATRSPMECDPWQRFIQTTLALPVALAQMASFIGGIILGLLALALALLSFCFAALMVLLEFLLSGFGRSFPIAGWLFQKGLDLGAFVGDIYRFIGGVHLWLTQVCSP